MLEIESLQARQGATALTAKPKRELTEPSVDLLTPISRRFVLHWGEMGSRWGVNRTVAQIHALLFISGRPMHAEEIAETLAVARSNVSNSLRELLSYHLVWVTHQLGDRRDHYDTSRDVWDLLRTVARERKEREFDPTVQMLEGCVDDTTFADEDAGVRTRIKETLSLMTALSSWSEEMLRLEPATLMQIMKLGSRIQQVLRNAKGKGK
jgi:DNA-binding transcriptional regulator GbsR (MarR family)